MLRENRDCELHLRREKMADEGEGSSRESALKMMNTPLIKESDMSEDHRTDAVEVVTTAIDKFSASQDYENAARYIKDMLDKRMGQPWHVVVGQHFSFDITYEEGNLLYVFWGGDIAVLAFKAS